MVVIGALTVGIYLYTRMDEEIRSHVEQTFAEHYPHLNVSVGGARLIEGRGIAIYDLAISETASTRLQNHLVTIDEIMLVCDASAAQLVRGQLQVEQIVLKHPQLWISRESSGRWNLESLWPLPKGKKVCPSVEIQDAQISISDAQNPSLAAMVLQDIDLTITSSVTQSAATAAPENHPIDLHGTLAGPHLRRAEYHARFDPRQNLLHLQCQLEQLRLTPELQAWASKLGGVSLGPTQVQGRVDGKMVVQYKLHHKPQVSAQLRLTQGRIEDPRLPRPLKELSCSLQCENNSLHVKDFQAVCGSAQVALAMTRSGWGPQSPLALNLRVTQFALDPPLYRALPPAMQTQWDKFQPTGQGDANVQLTFDGQQWRPTVTLTGRNLEFESDKFSYRLQKGFGTLKYLPAEQGTKPRLDIDLTAYGGGQPLRIVGQVLDPKPGALGWVEITGRDLQIEQALIAALPKKTQRVIRSMRPAGKFHVHWRLDRTQPGQRKADSSLRLELADCQVNYKKFPYPLSGIHGLILAKNGRWTFRDLVSSGSRNVQCHGHLRPVEAGNELVLHFTGQQISLDDDLRQALPPAVQKAWAQLRPRGRVGMAAKIHHLTGQAKPNIHVTLQPDPESASITPTFFPYLLENIEGELTFREGHLLMSQMRARHGRTAVRTNGSGYFDPQGGWKVQFEGLAVDKLRPHRDLMVALPIQLRKLIEQLQPNGSFSIHNALLGFSKPNDPLAPVDSHWDMQLGCHQTDLSCGIELKNVHGTVRLVGQTQGARSYSSGELAIDTATFQDMQFTDIRGPIWMNNSRFLLGRWASQKLRKPEQHVTAKAYGGQIVADAQVLLDGLPKYVAEMSLTEANLARITTERFSNSSDYRGKVSAVLRLKGTGRSIHALTGDGQVQIRDAKIYEIPLLVGMLKLLRNRTPDTTAFNQSEIKFRVQGPHVVFDQIDFIGDAVSLLGKGTANFDQRINLVFHSIVGRNDIRIPLVKNILGQTSQQILQMYVGGTFADPKVQTQAFPGIKQLIQQIQSELEPPTLTNKPIRTR